MSSPVVSLAAIIISSHACVPWIARTSLLSGQTLCGPILLIIRRFRFQAIHLAIPRKGAKPVLPPKSSVAYSFSGALIGPKPLASVSGVLGLLVRAVSWIAPRDLRPPDVLSRRRRPPLASGAKFQREHHRSHQKAHGNSRRKRPSRKDGVPRCLLHATPV